MALDPSHCRIEGNEWAGILVKKGTLIKGLNKTNIPLHSLEFIIHLHRLSLFPHRQYVLNKNPNSTMDRDHLLQYQAIFKINLDINPQLGTTETQ
jgi:hypothetical protein